MLEVEEFVKTNLATVTFFVLCLGGKLLADSSVNQMDFKAVSQINLNLARQNPDLVTAIPYEAPRPGSSLLPQYLYRYGKANFDGPRAAVLILGGLHGNEEMNLVPFFGQKIVERSQRASLTKAYFDRGGLIYIAPRMNQFGSRDMQSTEYDLNRQFFYFDGQDEYSSQTPVANFLKIIEREVLTHQIDLKFMVDYHCCEGALYYPWASRNQDPSPADMTVFSNMGAKFRHIFGAGYAFGRIQVRPNSGDQYPEQNVYGSSIDYFYSKYGTYSFAFEGQGLDSETQNMNRHLAFLESLLSHSMQSQVRPWSGRAVNVMPVQKTQAIRDFLNERGGKRAAIPSGKILNVEFKAECRMDGEGDLRQMMNFFSAKVTNAEEPLKMAAQIDHHGDLATYRGDFNTDQPRAYAGFVDFESSKDKVYRVRGLLRSPDYLNEMIFYQHTNRGNLSPEGSSEVTSKPFKFGADNYPLEVLIWGSQTASLFVVHLTDKCGFHVEQRYDLNLSQFPMLKTAIDLEAQPTKILSRDLPPSSQPHNYLRAQWASHALLHCSATATTRDGYMLTAGHCLCETLIEDGLAEKFIDPATKVEGCRIANQTPHVRLSGKRERDIHDSMTTMVGLADEHPILIAVGKSSLIERGETTIPISARQKILEADDDWAVLKYNTKSPLVCAKVAPRPAKHGDPIWAIGAPAAGNTNRQLYTSLGKVIESRLDIWPATIWIGLPRGILALDNPAHEILTTLGLEGGYSGSGLFNDQGELLGVNTSGLNDHHEQNNLGTAAFRLDYIQQQISNLLGPQKLNEIFNCPE